MTGSANGHPRDGLSAYLDDELAVEERAAMDRHLAECEDCRDELEALRILAEAVASEKAPSVPGELPGRIGRRLDAETVVPFPRRRFIVPATIAATLGAIGLLVALQWREGRLVAPATSVPQERDRAFNEAHRSNESPTSVPPEDTPARQVPPEPETARSALEDAADKPSHEPALEELSKEKKDERVVNGALGGFAEADAVAPAAVEPTAVEPPAVEPPTIAPPAIDRRDSSLSSARNEQTAAVPPPPAAKSAAALSCLERWSDSGLSGSWAVPDVGEAQRQLGRIAHAVGGNGLWRGVAEGRPYIVLVPREHFEEVVYALRARGVSGLTELPTLAEGTDCKGISITLAAAP